MTLILLRSQRDALQNLEAELHTLEQTVREKQNNLKVCEQAIKKQHQEIGRRRIEMQQADTLVDELQDALDADAIEEGRLDVLKEQLEEAKSDKTTYEASYGEFVIAKDQNTKSLKTTREQMSDLDKKIEEAEVRVTKAESKATRCSDERTAALRDKNEAIEAVEKEKSDLEVYRNEKEDKVARVASFTEQANVLYPRVRVDEGETLDSLERKIEKLEKDLKAAEKR